MLRVAMMGAAVALAVSAAGVAFAEEMPSYTLTVYPNGRMVTVPLDKKMTEEVLGHSKAATEPLMVTVSGGKAYLTSDTKMPSGKMMSEYMATEYWNAAAHMH
jgi:hypothetical protein